MLQVCQLVAVRLEHVSGRVTCKDVWSRWGCDTHNYPSCLQTIIVKNGNLWMPKTRNGTGTGFYDNDDVLIFKKDDRLDKGEEHQIWYGQDF